MEFMTASCKLCKCSLGNVGVNDVYQARLEHYRKCHPQEVKELELAFKGYEEYLLKAMRIGLWLRT